MENTASQNDSVESLNQTERSKPRRKLWTRINLLLRRIHLYAGLFLLPWVFLYGITGAMYNHQGLFPESIIHNVDSQQLANGELKSFPSADKLANQVVEALRTAAPDSDISLAKESGAAFSNDIVLEVQAAGNSHSVHIDPVDRSAKVVVLPAKEVLVPALGNVNHASLKDNPYQMARKSVSQIMKAAGIEGSQTPRPRGWCKLNFLANVDGKPARVTYVLRDGHVDVTRHEGKDGMTSRQFFMRLHTTHGQPPHWNGRMFWSVLLDAMAIAMVTWGSTGIIMWWQIKRTRLIGGIVIACSLLAASWLFFNMVDFYATTVL